MQFDPAAGFRSLDSWALAAIIRLATRRFCRKFLTRDLDPCGRQFDQMTQAARAGAPRAPRARPAAASSTK
jgi:hypothetical protein